MLAAARSRVIVGLLTAAAAVWACETNRNTGVVQPDVTPPTITLTPVSSDTQNVTAGLKFQVSANDNLGNGAAQTPSVTADSTAPPNITDFAVIKDTTGGSANFVGKPQAFNGGHFRVYANPPADTGSGLGSVTADVHSVTGNAGDTAVALTTTGCPCAVPNNTGKTYAYRSAQLTTSAALVDAGWDGTSSTSVTVRLTNKGGASQNDGLTVLGTNLGSVDMGDSGYVTADADFTTSSMTVSTVAGVATVTITLGTTTGSSFLGQVTGTPTATWTPSSSATDKAGNTVATTSRTMSTPMF